jgi:hypothetical protein
VVDCKGREEEIEVESGFVFEEIQALIFPHIFQESPVRVFILFWGLNGAFFRRGGRPENSIQAKIPDQADKTEGGKEPGAEK